MKQAAKYVLWILKLFGIAFVICLVILLFSLPARADRIDELKAQGKQAYCQWAARHILNGAEARLHDIPLVFSVVKEKDATSKVNINDEGFQIVDDNITEQEVDHTKRNIAIGWHLMDAYLLQHPRPVTSNTPSAVGFMLRHCMQYQEV